MSWVSIIAGIIAIIHKLMGWRSDQDQRQIGRQEGTIEGFEKGKANAETRAKIESEVGKLSPAELRAELERDWMRDKAPDSD